MIEATVMHLRHLFILLLISDVCRLATASPFQLITQEGAISRRSGQLLSSLGSSKDMSVIGLADFDPETSTTFANKLFQTNFKSDSRGRKFLLSIWIFCLFNN